MTAPIVNPIEIQIRDGIAVKLALMTQANDYYYNVGDINQFDLAKVVNFPRVTVELEEETNLEENGNTPNFTHYTNKVQFRIVYQWQSTTSVRTADRHLIGAKMGHDLKKLFGDYTLLNSYGCYQVRPIGYKILSSANETYPVSTEFLIECEYYQRRAIPTNQ